jgi:hypothetical protein
LLTGKTKDSKETKRRGSKAMDSSDSKEENAEELHQDEKGSSSVPMEVEQELNIMQMVVSVQRMEKTHV